VEKVILLFTTGGVEKLEATVDQAFDGIILSNIIDNLLPQDTIIVLTETRRILKPGGKVLVKLNPYLTDNQIMGWNIKIIEKNFLDDRLYLWNQSTEEWTELLEKYFSILNTKKFIFLNMTNITDCF
jgi:ubiquinone/menaquinone biosynthesis C-methylase UbiE